MGLDAGFLAMLQTTVSWEPFTGEDPWGNNTYGAPSTIPAYVESDISAYSIEEIGGQKLLNPTKTSTVYTDAEGIGVKDRITTEEGLVILVTQVQTYQDEFGVDLFQQVTGEQNRRG